MTLYYLDSIRDESDENLVKLALRKGWKQQPEKPECGEGQVAVWNWMKENWEIEEAPELAETFDSELSKGFYVESEGFYLAMQDADRNQWTALRSQLLDGLSMEKITHDTPILIWDNEGKPHQITVNKIREILFDAGIWYIQLSAKYKLG